MPRIKALKDGSLMDCMCVFLSTSRGHQANACVLNGAWQVSCFLTRIVWPVRTLPPRRFRNLEDNEISSLPEEIFSSTEDLALL